MIIRFGSIEFDPHDLWVGVYWNRPDEMEDRYLEKVVPDYEVYICIIPMFPIKFDVWRQA